jgi:hypothetical protein
MSNKKTDNPFNLSQREWDDVRQKAKVEILNNKIVSKKVRAKMKQKSNQTIPV